MKTELNSEEICLAKATEKDVPAIWKLMQEAYEQLECKEWYVMDDISFIKEHISNQGFTVAAYDKEEKLVGFCIIRIPMEAEDNLGSYLSLSLEEKRKVIHMESAVVSSTMRGLGLQRKMMSYAEDLLKDTSYTYFMATVHPDNIASRKSLLNLGYEVIATVEKYGGLPRNILLKRRTHS